MLQIQAQIQLDIRQLTTTAIQPHLHPDAKHITGCKRSFLDYMCSKVKAKLNNGYILANVIIEGYSMLFTRIMSTKSWWLRKGDP